MSETNYNSNDEGTVSQNPDTFAKLVRTKQSTPLFPLAEQNRWPLTHAGSQTMIYQRDSLLPSMVEIKFQFFITSFLFSSG